MSNINKKKSRKNRKKNNNNNNDGGKTNNNNKSNQANPKSNDKYFDQKEAQSLTEIQKKQVHTLSEMLSIQLQDAHIICNDCKWIQEKYPLSLEDAQKMLHWNNHKSFSKKKRDNDKHKQLSQENSNDSNNKHNNHKNKDKNNSHNKSSPTHSPSKPSKSPQKQHRNNQSHQNHHNHDNQHSQHGQQKKNNKQSPKFGGFVPHQHQKSGSSSNSNTNSHSNSNSNRDRPQTPTKRERGSPSHPHHGHGHNNHNHGHNQNRDNRDHRNYYNEYNDNNNYNQHRSRPPRFQNNNGHGHNNHNHSGDRDNYHSGTSSTKHNQHRDKSKLNHPKNDQYSNIASNRIVLQTSPSASRPPSNTNANQSRDRSNQGQPPQSHVHPHAPSHPHNKNGGRPPHLAPPGPGSNHRPSNNHNSNKIVHPRSNSNDRYQQQSRDRHRSESETRTPKGDGRDNRDNRDNRDRSQSHYQSHSHSNLRTIQGRGRGRGYPPRGPSPYVSSRPHSSTSRGRGRGRSPITNHSHNNRTPTQRERNRDNEREKYQQQQRDRDREYNHRSPKYSNSHQNQHKQQQQKFVHPKPPKPNNIHENREREQSRDTKQAQSTQTRVDREFHGDQNQDPNEKAPPTNNNLQDRGSNNSTEHQSRLRNAHNTPPLTPSTVSEEDRPPITNNGANTDPPRKQHSNTQLLPITQPPSASNTPRDRNNMYLQQDTMEREDISVGVKLPPDYTNIHDKELEANLNVRFGQPPVSNQGQTQTQPQQNNNGYNHTQQNQASNQPKPGQFTLMRGRGNGPPTMSNSESSSPDKATRIDQDSFIRNNLGDIDDNDDSKEHSFMFNHAPNDFESPPKQQVIYNGTREEQKEEAMIQTQEQEPGQNELSPEPQQQPIEDDIDFRHRNSRLFQILDGVLIIGYDSKTQRLPPHLCMTFDTLIQLANYQDGQPLDKTQLMNWYEKEAKQLIYSNNTQQDMELFNSKSTQTLLHCNSNENQPQQNQPSFIGNDEQKEYEIQNGYRKLPTRPPISARGNSFVDEQRKQRGATSTDNKPRVSLNGNDIHNKLPNNLSRKDQVIKNVVNMNIDTASTKSSSAGAAKKVKLNKNAKTFEPTAKSRSSSRTRPTSAKSTKSVSTQNTGMTGLASTSQNTQQAAIQSASNTPAPLLQLQSSKSMTPQQASATTPQLIQSIQNQQKLQQIQANQQQLPTPTSAQQPQFVTTPSGTASNLVNGVNINLTRTYPQQVQAPPPQQQQQQIITKPTVTIRSDNNGPPQIISNVSNDVMYQRQQAQAQAQAQQQINLRQAQAQAQAQAHAQVQQQRLVNVAPAQLPHPSQFAPPNQQQIYKQQPQFAPSPRINAPAQYTTQVMTTQPGTRYVTTTQAPPQAQPRQQFVAAPSNGQAFTMNPAGQLQISQLQRVNSLPLSHQSSNGSLGPLNPQQIYQPPPPQQTHIVSIPQNAQFDPHIPQQLMQQNSHQQLIQ